MGQTNFFYSLIILQASVGQLNGMVGHLQEMGYFPAPLVYYFFLYSQGPFKIRRQGRIWFKGRSLAPFETK